MYLFSVQMMTWIMVLNVYILYANTPILVPTSLMDRLLYGRWVCCLFWGFFWGGGCFCLFFFLFFFLFVCFLFFLNHLKLFLLYMRVGGKVHMMKSYLLLNPFFWPMISNYWHWWKKCVNHKGVGTVEKWTSFVHIPS